MTHTRVGYHLVLELETAAKRHLCRLFSFCVHLVCLEILEPYRHPCEFAVGLWRSPRSLRITGGPMLMLFKGCLAWFYKILLRFILCSCRCVSCVWVPVPQHLLGGQRTVWELVLSFQHMGPGDRTQGARFGSRHFTHFGIFLAILPDFDPCIIAM